MVNPYHYDKFGDKVSAEKKYIPNIKGEPTKHYKLGDYSEPVKRKKRKDSDINNYHKL